MKFKILITGSTGMVGKAVLLECLDNDAIEKILVLNRNPIGLVHKKLTEIILKDFSTINTIKDKIFVPDACFHCMGVSVVGLSETEYLHSTFEISKSIADLCYTLNPDMTFIYVSGKGTDSSEKSSQMWARIKGKTENYIIHKGFKKSLMFRAGLILPERGIRSKTFIYNLVYLLIRPLFPVLRKSSNITTTSKMGKAMINSLMIKTIGNYFENKQINFLATQTLPN